MKLTLNKQSALAVMRKMRATKDAAEGLAYRTNIISPDPSPCRAWSRSAISKFREHLPFPLQQTTLHIAVPDAASRIRAAGISCTVYGSGVPDGSFIDIGF